MTLTSPKLSNLQSGVIGVVLAFVTVVSSWLFVGRDWIERTAEDRRQIAVNTQRLDALEHELPQMITTSTHQELLDRVSRLETLLMQKPNCRPSTLDYEKGAMIR